MTSRELYPVVVFTVILIIAILLGNWFLTYVFNRPLEEIPNFFKFIVHGVSLVIVGLSAKKFFSR